MEWNRTKLIFLIYYLGIATSYFTFTTFPNLHFGKDHGYVGLAIMTCILTSILYYLLPVSNHSIKLFIVGFVIALGCFIILVYLYRFVDFSLPSYIDYIITIFLISLVTIIIFKGRLGTK
jgi:hypothetical protein